RSRPPSGNANGRYRGRQFATLLCGSISTFRKKEPPMSDILERCREVALLSREIIAESDKYRHHLHRRLEDLDRLQVRIRNDLEARPTADALPARSAMAD